MRNAPIYEFKDLNSTGVTKVPLNGIIYINDIDGNETPKMIRLLSMVGLNDESTIGDLLDTESLYTLIDGIPNELEKITEGGNEGWILYKDDRNFKGDIGQHAIDFSIATFDTTKGATGENSLAEGQETTASGQASHAEGSDTTASGFASHVEGQYNSAVGSGSHAEGYSTEATGDNSHAEGKDTNASGDNSHAAGYGTVALNDNMTVIGQYNSGLTDTSLFEIGIGTNNGNRKNAFEVHNDGKILAPEYDPSLMTDNKSIITKEYVEQVKGEVGQLQKIEENGKIGWYLLDDDRSNKGEVGEHSIDFSLSENDNNHGATGSFSFAEGYDVTASGEASHAEGSSTTAGGRSSHAEGSSTIASGINTHAEGNQTQAEGNYSHAAGSDTKAVGEASCANGISTIALNQASATFGKFNIGTSVDTIVEIGIGIDDTNRANAFEIYNNGKLIAPSLEMNLIDSSRSLITKEYFETNSVGEVSQLQLIIENNNTGWALYGDNRANKVSIGTHALDFSIYRLGNGEGASGNNSIAEGYGTLVTGENSHVMGYATQVHGNNSVGEGFFTVVNGNNSHAEGSETKADGLASHAEGIGTIALNNGSHAAGRYNIGTSFDTIHETGIGTDNSNRKNAFEIYTDGRLLAPELDTSLITDDKALITKEYLEIFAGNNSQLELITENGLSGWVLLGEDRTVKADIGYKALDFSFADQGVDYGPTGDYSTTFGFRVKANGMYSFANGSYNVAYGTSSHAEGNNTEATGNYSHAEGVYNTAVGLGSHAEGYHTVANGSHSHAEGAYTTANRSYSHAEGFYTVAQNEMMHVAGKYNIGTAGDTLFEFGVGVSDSDRRNALEIYADGRILAPELAISNIVAPYSLTTKDYVDDRVDNLDIESLNNVVVTNPQVDEYLQFDGSLWVNTTLPTYSINDLSDVDTLTIFPTNDDYLAWDGANWIPRTFPIFNLDLLDDVDTSTNSPIDGQVLKWNSTSSLWKPANDIDTTYTAGTGLRLIGTEFVIDTDTDNISEGTTNLYYTDTRVVNVIGSTSINGLNDVDTTSTAPNIGDALEWNGVNWVPGVGSGNLKVQIDEYNFVATSGQTSFVVNGVIFTSSECNVYINGLYIKKANIAVSDDGTDTTVTISNTNINTNDEINVVVHSIT